MSDKPIHDSDEEARVERARQPPEPAKPYGDDDLAFFRERARQRLFSLSGPPARLLATINLREAERDELREAVRALLDELSQSVSRCEHHMGCEALATQYLAWEGDSETMCDEHAQATAAADAPDRVEDLSYAPALRRLRALVEKP